MTISSILLKCNNCRDKIGSLDIDDISLVSPAEVIQFLVSNRKQILCYYCNCKHEFED